MNARFVSNNDDAPNWVRDRFLALRVPQRPAPVKRPLAYWYHPESDSAFTTDNRVDEDEALRSDCVQLQRWEYESVKTHLELGTPIDQRRPHVGGF